MIKVENRRFEANGNAYEIIRDIGVAVDGVVEALGKRLGRDLIVEQIKGVVEIALMADEEAEKHWKDTCKKDPRGAALVETITRRGFERC